MEHTSYLFKDVTDSKSPNYYFLALKLGELVLTLNTDAMWPFRRKKD